MGAYWLHWAPEYLSADGVRFRVEDGWRTRARRSGGFDSVLAVQAHHTVSKTAVANDIAYCWYNADTRPIGNIILDRTGLVHIGTAGASNTAGKGGPRWGSRGPIPLDSGNRHVIAIEACNDGVGERWPTVQTEAYVRLCAALLKGATAETPGAALGPGDVHAHFEWAPTRKTDPRGTSTWATAPLELWNMDAFRGSVFQALRPPTPQPVPVPPTGDVQGDDFMLVAVTVNSGPFYVSNGLRTGALHVPTQAPFEIIGMGAFDVGSKRRVTSWEQCTPVTKDQAFALLGSKV